MEEPLIILRPLSKEHFDLMYSLRWNVLRKPWNQPKGSEKDDIENESYPFIVVYDEKVVATSRLHKNSENEGQIRYLAVKEEYRNQRIGNKLVRYIEGFATCLGLKIIILNARKTAKDFFEKIGYNIIGEGPLLFDEIEHFIMRKELQI
jgi:N-acetylglutamate synthase-like GNAT family acetyltransferase